MTRIITWNTQGNFTEAEKWNIINRYAAQNEEVIVCIQEGGVDRQLNHNPARNNNPINIANPLRLQSYRGQNPGAFNRRCTNYILLNPHALGVAVNLQLPAAQRNYDIAGPIVARNGRVVIAGGTAGRTSIAVLLGGTLFVSWHSTANNSCADTMDLIQVIDDNYGGRLDGNNNFLVQDVVIAGDYNNTPQWMRTRMVDRDFTRLAAGFNFQGWSVTAPDQPTHQGGEVLDYYIIMRRQPITELEQMGWQPEVHQTVPSDHNLVELIIN